MQKIFTLLLSLFVVSTLFGTSPRLLNLSSVNKSDASVLTTNQKKALQVSAHNYSKKALLPAKATAQKLPAQHSINLIKKTADVINLDGGVFLVEPEYDAEAQEWYLVVESNGYTFRLCWYGKEDTYCGNVTMDDISISYTWGWYMSEDVFYEIYLTDVNMTISEKQVSEHLSQVVIDATLVDTEDRTYALHVEHNTYIPKSTVKNVISNASLTIGEGQFLLDGENVELDIALTVNAYEVGNFYTLNDFDMENTTILYNGQEQQLLKADLFLQMGILDDGAIGYYVDFSFLNQDTILHKVSMNSPLPPAKDTINVECKDLVVDESLAAYGFIMITGATEHYDIFAMYEGEYAEQGVFENISVIVTDKATWLDNASIYATLNLKETADGWQANIEAYCADYNWYSINMTYEVPTPTDTVKICFDKAAIATYNPFEANMIQLLNYGDDYEASVTVYGVALGEEFTMENVLLDYSGIYDWSVEATVKIADIKGVLNQHGDTTTISASVIGFDAIQYDIELWYTAPTPIDTVYIDMPIEFENAMDFGYYTLSSYTPDSAWYIALSPITDEVAGTFINDGMFGKFGASDGRYDFYGGNTFVYSEKEQKNYTVEKGSLVVTMAADSTIIAEAEIICSNQKLFHIKMSSKYNTHLDFDEPSIEVDRIYTPDDYVTIDDQTANYGYIYISFEAADGSDVAAFFFFTPETDPDIIIPEGVYPINSTEEYGTVYANPGVQGDGVWPSFYAQLLEDGSIVVPLWLLVSGTVEVTKDDAGNPYLEVNAFNSYGVPVHIVFDGGGTGVDNLHVDNNNMPHKVIRNHQLYIIQDGKMFNTIGQCVK